MIRDSIADYLRDQYDVSERQKIAASDAGWSRDHWNAFAHDLGLLGAGIDQAHGGLGGGNQMHAIVMEQFGRALVTEPYLATTVIAGGFLQHGFHLDATALLGQLIEGDLIVAYAHGEPGTRYDLAHVTTRAERIGPRFVLQGIKSTVLGAPFASHLIVVARSSGSARDRYGLSVFLVPAGAHGIERRDFRTISGAPASEVTLDNVAVPASALLAETDCALPLIERVVDTARAALCAEGVGVISRMLDDTVAYTKERHQFGVPIGSFQALQHRMADMLIQVTLASSITERAVKALNRPDVERARAISAAKAFVGKAARFVAQNAVQLHGGMGMTDELPLGSYFKRAFEIERQFGDVDYHVSRFGRLSDALAEAA